MKLTLVMLKLTT